ncbi:hypothetical protein COV93_02220 [Candidatus Woesearchaeota archaeon CG11_big_fil_rev_8_21_14_0_20_43_8]|nr:MAG: hypothetical protein COV93_02220 [Candidatus Woesearchaeota archaeon CG11_big_fil_rev_8_21_14_0_20_43_8]
MIVVAYGSYAGSIYNLTFTVMEPKSQMVMVNETAVYQIYLNNTGNTTEPYNFSLQIDPSVIFDFMPINATIANQTARQVNVTLNSSIEGMYSFNITAFHSLNASILFSSFPDVGQELSFNVGGAGGDLNYSAMWALAHNVTDLPQMRSLFDFNGAPFIARGPGCKMMFNEYETAMPGQNCCGVNGAVSLDISAVLVDQAAGLIGWHIVGPGVENDTLSHCVGGENKAAFVVEFDVDDNQSTGCDSATEGCYPGSDYQIWYFPDNHTGLFAYYNGSNPKADGRPAGGACPGNICFVANASVDVYAYVNCSPDFSSAYPKKIDDGISFAINKSVLPQPIMLNFETNSFNTSGVDGPIDQLTNYDGGQFVDAFLVMGPSQKAGSACYMYDDNQTGCLNQSTCIWKPFSGGMGMCDPDFASFSKGDACFTYTDEENCTASDLGFCEWIPNAKTPQGTQDICVEQFMPGQFSGGDCDSDCFHCFTENQCENSEANGGSDYGGCSWYNDSFNPVGWCDMVGLNFGCDSVPDDCFTPSMCSDAGWYWNSTYSTCIASANAEICFNGIDDDSDGDTDCEDTGCEMMKFCGGSINVLTGDYAGMDPEDALMMQLGVGIGNEVLFLKDDAVNEAGNDSIDILGFGMTIGPNAIGIGIPIANLSELNACGGEVVDRRFVYMIDSDGNESSGCNVTMDSAVGFGFEYAIRYGNYAVANDSGQSRQLYACFNSTWILRDAAIIPGKSRDPMGGPGAPMEPMECGEMDPMFGVIFPAVVMVEKASIGNPTSDMRFTAMIINGSWDDFDNLSTYDTIVDAYYTPGTMDFSLVDCSENPTSCGSEFMIVGGGEFMPFEDCMMPGDEDLDGLSNCADSDCAFAPHCMNAPDRFNTSLDKTAPRTTMSKVDEFEDAAFVMWTTNEPTNGTLRFYGNDSACRNLNTSIFDQGMPGTFDDFRAWHNVPIDMFSIGYPLNLSTTYHYKLLSYDGAGNKALSKCLNFTTLSAPKNISLLFNFTSPAGSPDDFLGNLSIIVDGMEKGVGSSFEEADMSDVNITLFNPTANASMNWSIELVGADICQAMELDFSDMFIANDTGELDEMVGMSNLGWTEMAQKMGVDYVIIKIPDTSARLFHCNDEGMNCTDVTDQDTRDGRCLLRLVSACMPAAAIHIISLSCLKENLPVM